MVNDLGMVTVLTNSDCSTKYGSSLGISLVSCYPSFLFTHYTVNVFEPDGIPCEDYSVINKMSFVLVFTKFTTATVQA